MIDPNLQAILNTKFNPEGSELRKYQLYLLQMLKDFDEICKEIGVKYWLSSGTLIGALRHGGFIPWDDDIDVEMMKEDYKKLLRHFKESNKYVIQSNENDRSYFQSFAKFRDKDSMILEHQDCQKYYKYNGIFIDILVMNMTYKKMSKRLYQLIDFFSKPLRYKNNLPSFLIRTSQILVKYVFKLIPYIEKHYANREDLEFGHDYGSYFYNRKRDYSKLFPLKDTKFENYLFPIPNDADSYLKATYGDWESLPDLNNLHPHLIDVQYL